MAKPRPRISALCRYWFSLGNGEAPERTFFDPTEIPSLLPSLILADIEVHPFRVRYRLTGTLVDKMSGINLTGRYLNEFATGRYRSAVEDISSRYEMVTRTGLPYIGPYEWPSDAVSNVERVVWMAILPLSVGGKIRQRVAVEEFGPITVRTKPVDWSMPLKAAANAG